MQAQRHARVRVGAHEIAVPAHAVLSALRPGVPLATLPRREGPAVGACDTPWGMVPVVDLARWLDLGPEATAGSEVLVLRDGCRRVAVRVDALLGVAPACSVERLLHDEDPRELFQSAVRWSAGGELVALLEVGRLADLAQAWAPGGPPAAAASAPATDPAVHATPHAVLAAGVHLWAIPTAQLVQVVPAPRLEYALAGATATLGFCSWGGTKLPVVDLGRLHGKPAAAGRLVAVVADGQRAAALAVDDVRQVLPLAPSTAWGAAPLLVPGLGEVHPVDAVDLLQRLPEATLGGPLRRVRAAIGAGTAADITAAHVLFENDATYATPAERVLQVVALDGQQARDVARGVAVHLAWKGRMVPVHPLPCYSGRAVVDLPRVALLVDVPGGEHGPVAIAVARLHGWETTARAAGLRVSSVGDMKLLTVGEGAARTSHVVVDLGEVAYAFA